MSALLTIDPAVITLAGDTWSSENGASVTGAKRTAKDLALDVLIDEIARGHATIPPATARIPPDTLCITVGAWRKAYELRAVAESEKVGRRAFFRAAKQLTEKLKLVAKHDLWVWPVEKVQRARQ